jgi:acetylornithine aminotransferase/acetylornithine/N-succinyldiaminopimelate aminotransferase
MLAMAAVSAALDTLVDDDLMERATEIHTQIQEQVGPHGAEVRGKGCLIGLRLDRPAAPVKSALLEQGVLVGTSADPHVLRIMPPLTSTDEDVALFAETFATVMQREDPVLQNS